MLRHYLSNYRMMNDYISILTAEVIDLSIEVSIVLTSAQNSGQVIADVVDRISTYFNPQVRELGQNVYLSEIQSIVQNQNGVLTVSGLKFSIMLEVSIRPLKHLCNILILKQERFNQSTQQFLHNHHRYIKSDIRVKILRFRFRISNLLLSHNRFIIQSFGL
jgi:hypothetical protein